MADQSSNIGAGQQLPEDSNSEFWVIAFIARQLIAQLETMIPVQVQAVHAGAGSPPAAGAVDVQLLISQLDGAGNAVKPGIVYGLPYFRLQGGPWAIICDPAANDFGFIIAASRDISNVVKNPGIQNPGSYRKYSYADGIYVGGCCNAVPAATAWFKSDGTLNITDKFGNSLVSSSTGWAVKGNLAVTGMITATQEITAATTGNNVNVSQHVHTGTDSHGDTLSINPPTPGS